MHPPQPEIHLTIGSIVRIGMALKQVSARQLGAQLHLGEWTLSRIVNGQQNLSVARAHEIEQILALKPNALSIPTATEILSLIRLPEKGA